MTARVSGLPLDRSSALEIVFRLQSRPGEQRGQAIHVRPLSLRHPRQRRGADPRLGGDFLPGLPFACPHGVERREECLGVEMLLVHAASPIALLQLRS